MLLAIFPPASEETVREAQRMQYADALAQLRKEQPAIYAIVGTFDVAFASALVYAALRLEVQKLQRPGDATP